MSKLGHFECHNIGTSTTECVQFAQKTNITGEPYWEAVLHITHLLGSEVQGCEVRGIGRTKEEALERLSQDRKNLTDSLWA